MATIAASPQPVKTPLIRSRGKTAVFAFIGVMLVYVFFKFESFLWQPDHPVWARYEPFKWWLLPHGLTAAAALLLGPFQFSDRLRKKYTKAHRVAGRFYVAGTFIGAPLGIYIQHLQGIVTFTFAAGVDAILWMTTTAIAMFFILRGNIAQHRQWMTRSYACAIVFLEVRFILGIFGLENAPMQVSEAVVWGCLAFALLFADLLIQLQEMPRPAKAKIGA